MQVRHKVKREEESIRCDKHLYLFGSLVISGCHCLRHKIWLWVSLDMLKWRSTEMMEEWEKEQERERDCESTGGNQRKDWEDWEGAKRGIYLSCWELTWRDGCAGVALTSCPEARRRYQYTLWQLTESQSPARNGKKMEGYNKRRKACTD